MDARRVRIRPPVLEATPTGSGQPRFFTVEEANRTLPLVSRIVRDLVAAYRPFQEQLHELHQSAASGRPDAMDGLDRLRDAINRAADEINGYIRELQQVGCIFKGFETGLVDFKSIYQGRQILLCWQLGEERVEHWHEVDSGYTGRQPITREIAEEIRQALPPE